MNTTEKDIPVKIIAFESGGDWADASVDYMVNTSGRKGEDLYSEYKESGGYDENGHFKEWGVKKGYFRMASGDDLDVVVEVAV